MKHILIEQSTMKFIVVLWYRNANHMEAGRRGSYHYPFLVKPRNALFNNVLGINALYNVHTNILPRGDNYLNNAENQYFFSLIHEIIKNSEGFTEVLFLTVIQFIYVNHLQRDCQEFKNCVCVYLCIHLYLYMHVLYLFINCRERRIEASRSRNQNCTL